MIALKIVKFFTRKEKPPEDVVIEVTVDARLYDELKRRADRGGLSENEVLLTALRTGMRDYWHHVIKDQREKYVVIENLFEAARKDHERLAGIVNQNVFFEEILSDESKKEEAVTES